MHMGIPVCKRAGIAEKFAYGDPITHNEIVRIWGLTYMLVPKCANCQYRYGAAHYRYWYLYSNLLAFNFLSAFFPKYDRIH